MAITRSTREASKRLHGSKIYSYSIEYNIRLTAIAKSTEPDIILARKLFEEAKTNNLANSYIYNSMLNVIAKSRPDAEGVEWALSIFEEARGSGLANEYTYNNMLNVIANSRPDAEGVEWALNIFEEARRNGLANNYVYNGILEVIANSKLDKDTANYAHKLFYEIKKQGLADHYTYNNTLKIILNIIENRAADADLSKLISEALDIFREAEESKSVDTYTYSNMLSVIAKSTEPNLTLALELLQNAKKNKLANEYVYSNVLNVIANSKLDAKLVEQARDVFEEAKSQELVNCYIYSNMLYVIARSVNATSLRFHANWVAYALQLFEQARDKCLLNNVVYANILDILVTNLRASSDTLRSDILAKANKLLAEAVDKYFPESKEPPNAYGDITVDLHRFSSGMAYLWIKQKFAELRLTTKLIRLHLIYGQGLHAKATPGKIHPLKEVTLSVLEEIKTTMTTHEINCLEEEYNPGQLNVTIKNKSFEQSLNNTHKRKRDGDGDEDGNKNKEKRVKKQRTLDSAAPALSLLSGGFWTQKRTEQRSMTNAIKKKPTNIVQPCLTSKNEKIIKENSLFHPDISDGMTAKNQLDNHSAGSFLIAFSKNMQRYCVYVKNESGKVQSNVLIDSDVENISSVSSAKNAEKFIKGINNRWSVTLCKAILRPQPNDLRLQA